jgi:hypothetical protein
MRFTWTSSSAFSDNQGLRDFSIAQAVGLQGNHLPLASAERTSRLRRFRTTLSFEGAPPLQVRLHMHDTQLTNGNVLLRQPVSVVTQNCA